MKLKVSLFVCLHQSAILFHFENLEMYVLRLFENPLAKRENAKSH